MRTLVIGNGFDLNLGLPTDYNSFVKSEIYAATLVQSGNRTMEYLLEKQHIQKWVDIEQELIVLSKSNLENFEQEYKELKRCLMDYLFTIDITAMDKESKAYELLYSVKDIDDLFIINFNYTNSVQYILQELDYKGNLEETVTHIHGSLVEKDIVFGVNDNANIQKKDIFLKKAFSPVFKGINLDHLFFSIASSLDFFGHSLGTTDHSYFKSYFRRIATPSNTKDMSITFHHYGDYGFHQIMQELDELTINRLTPFRQTNTIEFEDCSL